MAAENSFKPGDVVYLMSGSPQMTAKEVSVSEGDRIPFARCVWFAANELKEQTFPESTLKRADNQPPLRAYSG